MPIEIHEEFLKARAVPGPRLSKRVTMPEGSPKAMIGIIHGYADHAARYDRVALKLATAGFGVVAIDLRGHGRSEGPRGSCLTFSEFLGDAKELPRLLGDLGRGAPQFLFGHSFGGLVATSSVIEDPSPWRGLLLSGPFLRLALDVPRYKVLLGKVASRIAPHFAQKSGLKGLDVTHDAAIAKAYDTDPLIFKHASARWFTESIAAQDRLMQHAGDISLPLWVGFGTEDTLARLSAAEELLSRVSSSDKTLVRYPGLRHEILNEPSWESIVATMLTWMNQHL